MLRRIDIIASLVIGEAAALLMLAIGRNISLPAGPAGLLPFLPFVFPIFTLAVIIAGSFFSRRIAVAYQFSKFLLVGGLNFLVDLGVLNILIFATGIAGGFYVVSFKAVAFLVAVTSSFLLNKFWTFRALSVEHAGLQFFEFLVVSGVGIAVNVGIFALVNNWLGPQAGIDDKTWASVSAGSAAIAGLLWNFLGYKFVVFRK
ncbi:MAG: GtrA family protein [Candidatus Sungbacteria bacterium]|uniref:GtrA family protein n=1 Tax=Candidatus Sungiibacteriota bacterium TaxID=2750080 RepID=A0A932YX25_9BACT|nr:GtrA family protein [Candidatus Sungbacteria bacterium]